MENVQGFEKKLIQKKEMSYNQLYSLKILSMNSWELDEFLKSEEKENPFFEFISPEISCINLNSAYSVSNIQYDEIMNKKSIEENWREEIRLQINTEKMDKTEKEILNFFIDSLNGRGFLEISRKMLKKKFNINNKKIEELKSILKKADPVGIGSENLKEYFKCQLEHEGIKDRKIFKILERYLEEITNYRKICRELKITTEEFKKYFKLIKKLKKAPIDVSDEAHYIFPDISAKKINGKWEIDFEKDYSKLIKINEAYKNIIKNETEKEVVKYINEKTERIKLIMECIDKRESTIRQIVEIILRKQENFFINGEIVPMSQSEIAKELDKSKSTISRGIKNKYISLPEGTFKLKAFFSKKYGSCKNRKDVSSHEIKKYIKKIIESEDKIIYSDSKIMNKVNDKFNIVISRRTVTKYRNELSIQNKSMRSLSR